MAENGNFFGQGKRQTAILALLSSRSVGDAAAKAQIGKRTLARWMDEPDFREAFGRAKTEVVDRALDVLKGSSVQFAETIAGLSGDSTLAPITRLQAARDGLSIILRIEQHARIEQRLAELESEVRRIVESRRDWVP